MKRILSALLFICGFLALLMGIIDCDGVFFIGLTSCFFSWLIYPKKRKKNDGGKSYRNSKTWEGSR